MDSLQAIIAAQALNRKESAKSKPKAEEPDAKPHGHIKITSSNSYGYGESTEIPMANIQNYLRTNLKFRMVVFTNMAHTVGVGFYNTADINQLQGRKALDLCNYFTDEWDFDVINQKIALNEWAAGNTFLNKVSADPINEPDALNGIYKLPLSAFTHIKRLADGTPVEYRYSWGTERNKVIPAKEIISWPWLPLDEEAFGEGIGQALARKGLGYETESGNTVKRRDWFEQQERISDVADKHVIAGLPRYAVFLDPEAGGDDDTVTDLTSALNKLDPLQHIVLNSKGTLETIALETGTKFDSFLRMQNDEVITGMMSPLIRMWSSLDFTYASAESALKAMFPLFDMYQRFHKRSIEKQIYRPILAQENIDYHKADVQMNWGKQADISMADLKDLVTILKEPMFANKFSPEELIDSISETSGISLQPQVVDEQKAVINGYRQLDKDALDGKSMTLHYNPKKLSKLDLMMIQKLTKSRN